MDGLWNAGKLREQTQQAELTKHRLLRVNISTLGLTEPGDASSAASANPTGILIADGGPHFIMSPLTPDNSKTYGFEFCLSTIGISPSATGPFTVTIWALVGTSTVQDQVSNLFPTWAALSSSTVAVNELWHSFDVNAAALRFQIESADADQSASHSVMIAFSEL